MKTAVKIFVHTFMSSLPCVYRQYLLSHNFNTWLEHYRMNTSKPVFIALPTKLIKTLDFCAKQLK